MLEQVDIIGFGAHPDDVEIGCGGLLAKEVELGYKAGIVDLTRGEMSTNGTVEERSQEAEAAARILGAQWRLNLEVPDGHIEMSDEYLERVVRVLRNYRPRLIVVPYWEDRHPDHMAASQLITKAHFLAGLRTFCPDLEPYRPAEILYYFLNYEREPSFLVDITTQYEKKRESILAHQSQFGRKNEMLPTILNNSFPYMIESRDRHNGAKIKTLFAEGFVTRNTLAVVDPLAMWEGKA